MLSILKFTPPPLLLFVVLLVNTTAAMAQLSDGRSMLKQLEGKISNINTEQLKEIAQQDKGTVFLDIRSADEVAEQGGTMDLPRVHNVERSWLEFQIVDRVPNKDTPIVVFCGSNIRSPLTAHLLMQMGYTNVKNYQDGYVFWRDAGLPVKGDNAPNSMLYRTPQEVIPGVWSAIGATAPPDYFNSGHNNNLSFIVTGKGVVVVNASDNYLLAKSLHNEIKKITDQEVKYVILENAQTHGMLGSNYWQAQGAKIVAHADSAHEIETHGAGQLASARLRLRDKATGTQLTKPDIIFDKEHVIELGNERIEVLNLGPAHSPGDVAVWLPKRKLVISGDLAFHQRLLPVMEDTDTDGWIETWDKFLALGAEVVIPGHGMPTNYAEVTKYTHDYLVFIREKVSEIIDAGGDLQDAYKIDQSQFSHLDTFFELARQNAGRVYREMEFEF